MENKTAKQKREIKTIAMVIHIASLESFSRSSSPGGRAVVPCDENDPGSVEETLEEGSVSVVSEVCESSVVGESEVHESSVVGESDVHESSVVGESEVQSISVVAINSVVSLNGDSEVQ